MSTSTDTPIPSSVTLDADPEATKKAVQEKYAQIASSGESCCGPTSCCGPGDGADLDVTMIGDDYDDVDGYVADADLSLGCGVPTDLAGIESGHAVLDLGSGAGLDAFIARRQTGPSGRVVGVDVTPEMLDRARTNADKLGYDNVSFVKGDIEDLPLDDATFDVVISNCVLNLVPDKARAFAEMYRVIAPGGHFCVSDIVTRGALPDAVRHSAELYAGCVGGAIEHDDYLTLLRDAGFDDVEVVREKPIDVPDDVLTEHASAEEVAAFRASGGGIVSVTVRGVRR